MAGEAVAATAFQDFLTGVASKIDAPQELTDAIVAWFAANTQVSAEKVVAFALLVVTEMKSGHPGYNESHGGLA